MSPYLLYISLELEKLKKKKEKKRRKYCGYKIKQIQDGWTEKTQPAARKCSSVCTICCWYLLNGKSCVVFSYLHSFTLSDSVFLRPTATFQQTLEKARPHQAEGSCKKVLVGAIPQPQPWDTRATSTQDAAIPGQQTRHTPSLAHICFHHSKPCSAS